MDQDSLSFLLRSSITRGSLALIASNLGAGVLGFATSLVVARGLGVAEFGRWTYLLAWASALTMVAEFGVNTLLTREAALRPLEQNQLLISSLTLKIALTAIAAALVIGVSLPLHLDSGNTIGLRYAVLIGALGVVYSSFSAMFRARNWMTLILTINIAGLVAQFAGSIWIIDNGGAVLELILLLAMIDAAQVVVAVLIWLARAAPTAGPARVSSVAAQQLLRQSVPFGIAGAVGAIQLRSSPILLEPLSGALQVGVFGAAMRFTEAAKLIPNGIFDAIYPWFASHREPSDEVRKTYAAFARVVHVYVGAITLGLIVFAGALIRLTYGPRFGFGAWTLIILALALESTMHNAIAEVYLYAVGEEVFATRLYVVSALIQLVTGIPLMIVRGAAGAAAGIFLGAIAISIPLHAKARALIERRV